MLLYFLLGMELCLRPGVTVVKKKVGEGRTGVLWQMECPSRAQSPTSLVEESMWIDWSQ